MGINDYFFIFSSHAICSSCVDYKYIKVAFARIFSLFLFAILKHCVNNASSGLTSYEVSKYF
ncbi:hypothetical protein XCR1_4210006 [Xenorhabdus cabanillasii JM26]|uniref:Uncharacterized protein n=1 Tax=Xenorhabdus cabanillasii JM26 TaxID=1427517 RepID=W1J965_9GAMM|nr:hypothetical protein XCR1_4210006 [Xenorhabdus cabanillasii JM26]